MTHSAASRAGAAEGSPEGQGRGCPAAGPCAAPPPPRPRASRRASAPAVWPLLWRGATAARQPDGSAPYWHECLFLPGSPCDTVSHGHTLPQPQVPAKDPPALPLWLLFQTRRNWGTDPQGVSPAALAVSAKSNLAAEADGAAWLCHQLRHRAIRTTSSAATRGSSLNEAPAPEGARGPAPRIC